MMSESAAASAAAQSAAVLLPRRARVELPDASYESDIMMLIGEELVSVVCTGLDAESY